jgi:hypothetical protein
MSGCDLHDQCVSSHGGRGGGQWSLSRTTTACERAHSKGPTSPIPGQYSTSERAVMRDIKRAVPAEHCDDTPLMGVMEGAQSLGNAFQEVCKDIKNKVMILDIIHVLEYIWLMASVKYPAVDDQAKSDVYETLTLIFQGKVASYILELQNEMLTGKWKKSQKETLKKVITYLRNHKQYMK